VVATYEKTVAIYEPSMMEEMGAMPVGCVPAAHTASGHRHATTANHVTTTHVTATPTTHVAATAHVAAATAHVTATTTTMACHGERGQ
jgi:hypothetical protein